MIKLIISLIFYIGFGVSGYFSYYFIGVRDEKVLGVVFAIITVVCLVIAMIASFLFLNRKTKAQLSDYQLRLKKWSNIAYHASKAGDEVFNQLPIAILLYDESYQVKWSNNYAKQIFNNQLNDTPLDSISKDLLDDVILNKPQMLFSYNGKSYDVIHNIENDILYFFEVTEREQIKKRYNDRITGVGIIELDNLEESLKRFDMQEKANVRGQILGEVSDWISRYNCYLQSVTGDRMIIMMDKDSLSKMIVDKFSVLSAVREISQKNRLKASISMGIACHDVPYDELGSIAQSAIELAEKRGGDQVVVNEEGKKIQFFGGNTNSFEKNTLVEARMQAISLKEAVEGSSNVLIMCHNFADCDALGSMIGVFHMVQSSSIDVKMVFDVDRADMTVKKIYKNIQNDPVLPSYFVSLNDALELLRPTTLLIVTDTQSPNLAMFKELLTKAKRLSIIDHHRAGDDGWKNYLSYYVESSASSAVELVSEMFMFYNSDITVSPLEASIMLSGVIVDTNNFTMRAGTRTFEAAATLRSMGADMIYVRRLLQEPIDSEKLISEAITSAEVYGDKFGIVRLDEKKAITDRTLLAKISDRLLTINGVQASFTIGRIDEMTVGVSARSLGNNINVQTIMEAMGGGGHFNSAAVQIKTKEGETPVTIASVSNQLVEILRLEYVEGGGSVMKVILTQDVKGKGKKDDIIDVAAGYGNYLISNKMAIAASEENMQIFEKQQADQKKEAENKKKLLRKFRDEINGKSISIKLKVGAGGKNFGHITTKLVCDEFEAQTGIHLDRKKVELPGDINSIGIFTATVKIDTDIIANFEIKVEEKK